MKYFLVKWHELPFMSKLKTEGTYVYKLYEGRRLALRVITSSYYKQMAVDDIADRFGKKRAWKWYMRRIVDVLPCMADRGQCDLCDKGYKVYESIESPFIYCHIIFDEFTVEVDAYNIPKPIYRALLEYMLFDIDPIYSACYLLAVGKIDDVPCRGQFFSKSKKLAIERAVEDVGEISSPYKVLKLMEQLNKYLMTLKVIGMCA
ncbi:MAG: hypothetical protein DRJ47_06750 [Thermoprotei archaeon]|nr:MAG: hypothetical protein DRJ47_06750 [Thermoprotei archaeon]